MTRRELARAYPRLKREWPGIAVRLAQMRTTGLPDFVLVGRVGIIFAEVKWEGHTLSMIQAQRLDELARQGALTCELRATAAGWEAWGTPHLWRQRHPRPADWTGPDLRGPCAESLIKVLRRPRGGAG